MSSNESAYLLRSEGVPRISPLTLVLLFLSLSGYLLLGQFIAPVWILCLPIILGFGTLYLIKHESIMLGALILAITLIQLKPAHGSFTIYDALTGAIIVGSMVLVLTRRICSPNSYFIGNNQYTIFIIYFLWVSILGIENFLFSTGEIESWFRDILLISPLVIIPPLMVVMDKGRDRRIFFGVMLLTWVICVAISVIRVRSSFLEATYLFEVSYKMINGLNGPLMLLVFFNLFLFDDRKQRRYLYLLGAVISIVAIILTHNRTFWVLTPVGIGLSVILANALQRRKAFKLFLQLGFILGILFGILYYMFPVFRILIELFFSHFLSSSNLRTDPSLVGRYIEWRHIWWAILDSPIVGHGMGSTYHTYNWFAGYFYDSAYTHNGYLGVLQKGGVVGFILLFTAYLGFIKKGWTLMSKKTLDVTSQALIRTGFIMLLLILVALNTSNLFAHRDVMMYLAIIWGYFIYIDQAVEAKPKHAELQ